MQVESVLEGEINHFCRVCDFYKKGTHCPVVGQDDQIRYVQRNWCGWARYQKLGVNVTRENLTFHYPLDKKEPVLRDDKEGLAKAVQERNRVYGEQGKEKKSSEFTSVDSLS